MPGYKDLEQLEQDLQQLGACIDKFLTQQTTCVISNRLHNKQPCSTSKQPFQYTSPNLMSSRGRALLQKSSTSNSPGISSDVISTAKKRGLRTVSLQQVLKTIQKESGREDFAKPLKDKNPKARVRNLIGSFVKFEDLENKFKPEVGRFNKFPCAFDAAEMEKSYNNEKTPTCRQESKVSDKAILKSDSLKPESCKQDLVSMSKLENCTNQNLGSMSKQETLNKRELDSTSKPDTRGLSNNQDLVSIPKPETCQHLGSNKEEVSGSMSKPESHKQDFDSVSKQEESNKPDIGSNKPDVGSKKLDVGSNKPDVGSNKPDVGSMPKPASVSVPKSRNTKTSKLKHSKLNAAKKGKNKVKDQKKRGYCELCDNWYYSIKEHSRSLVHREFIQNDSNFNLLEQTISKLPTLEELVNSLTVKAEPDENHTTSLLNSDMPMLEAVSPNNPVTESRSNMSSQDMPVLKHVNFNKEESCDKENESPTKGASQKSKGSDTKEEDVKVIIEDLNDEGKDINGNNNKTEDIKCCELICTQSNLVPAEELQTKTEERFQRESSLPGVREGGFKSVSVSSNLLEKEESKSHTEPSLFSSNSLKTGKSDIALTSGKLSDVQSKCDILALDQTVESSQTSDAVLKDSSKGRQEIKGQGHVRNDSLSLQSCAELITGVHMVLDEPMSPSPYLSVDTDMLQDVHKHEESTETVKVIKEPENKGPCEKSSQSVSHVSVTNVTPPSNYVSTAGVRDSTLFAPPKQTFNLTMNSLDESNLSRHSITESSLLPDTCGPVSGVTRFTISDQTRSPKLQPSAKQANFMYSSSVGSERSLADKLDDIISKVVDGNSESSETRMPRSESSHPDGSESVSMESWISQYREACSTLDQEYSLEALGFQSDIEDIKCDKPYTGLQNVQDDSEKQIKCTNISPTFTELTTQKGTIENFHCVQKYLSLDCKDNKLRNGYHGNQEKMDESDAESDVTIGADLESVDNVMLQPMPKGITSPNTSETDSKTPKNEWQIRKSEVLSNKVKTKSNSRSKSPLSAKNLNRKSCIYSSSNSLDQWTASPTTGLKMKLFRKKTTPLTDISVKRRQKWTVQNSGDCKLVIKSAGGATMRRHKKRVCDEAEDSPGYHGNKRISKRRRLCFDGMYTETLLGF